MFTIDHDLNIVYSVTGQPTGYVLVPMDGGKWGCAPGRAWRQNANTGSSIPQRVTQTTGEPTPIQGPVLTLHHTGHTPII